MTQGALVSLLGAPLAAAAPPRARTDAQTVVETTVRPHVRVLSETASIYSGPGFAYRVLAELPKDQVLLMLERGKRGGWTRVRLETGISGYALTEQLFFFSAEEPHENDTLARRLRRKLEDHVFGPPALRTARIGGALSAGALGREGLFLVRPSIFVSPHVALEAYLGPASGRETSRGIFGLASNLYLTPDLPFSLFLSLGIGAVTTRSKADALPASTWMGLASPGGGLLFLFKYGLGLRFDVRHHVFFRADRTFARQEYSGALAFTF